MSLTAAIATRAAAVTTGTAVVATGPAIVAFARATASATTATTATATGFVTLSASRLIALVVGSAPFRTKLVPGLVTRPVFSFSRVARPLRVARAVGDFFVLASFVLASRAFVLRAFALRALVLLAVALIPLGALRRRSRLECLKIHIPLGGRRVVVLGTGRGRFLERLFNCRAGRLFGDLGGHVPISIFHHRGCGAATCAGRAFGRRARSLFGHAKSQCEKSNLRNSVPAVTIGGCSGQGILHDGVKTTAWRR